MSMLVVWTRPASDDMKRLDRKAVGRVLEAVQRFAEHGHGDVRRLTGYEAAWRLRVGRWRIRFTVEAGKLVVLHVLPRGSAYQK